MHLIYPYILSFFLNNNNNNECRISVFKYADKGYGIRFLPSYLDALKIIDPSSLLPEANLTKTSESTEAFSQLMSLDAHVAKARDYFERIFKTYMKWTKNGQNIKRHYIGNAYWKPVKVPYSGTTAKPPSKTPSGKKIGGKDGIPIFTHALLDTDDQTTSEPLRRSCLTGFQLLFRHVALWEAAQEEKVYLQDDVWASTTVGLLSASYLRPFVLKDVTLDSMMTYMAGYPTRTYRSKICFTSLLSLSFQLST